MVLYAVSLPTIFSYLLRHRNKNRMMNQKRIKHFSLFSYLREQIAWFLTVMCRDVSCLQNLARSSFNVEILHGTFFNSFPQWIETFHSATEKKTNTKRKMNKKVFRYFLPRPCCCCCCYFCFVLLDVACSLFDCAFRFHAIYHQFELAHNFERME